MAGTLQGSASLSRFVDPFVVRYNGSHAGFYIVRVLPLLIVFLILMALYIDDESRRLIFSRWTEYPKSFSWAEFGFLTALVIAAVIDLALVIRRVQQGAVALSISPEGLTTHITFRSGLIRWGEISDVDWDGEYISILWRPQSFARRLLARRGRVEINIPAHHLDHDVADILRAANRFRCSDWRAGPESSA